MVQKDEILITIGSRGSGSTFSYRLDAITKYLDMIWYNYGTKKAMSLTEAAIERIDTDPMRCKFSQDMYDLWAFIILLMGEYGTSPRGGWLSRTDGAVLKQTLLMYRTRLRECQIREDDDANESEE